VSNEVNNLQKDRPADDAEPVRGVPAPVRVCRCCWASVTANLRRRRMKTYLAFGGGVNSVALYLLLLDRGVEFEAIYVDHGADWPETREYVAAFAEKYPLTILRPAVRTNDGKVFADLYEYCKYKRVLPSVRNRWCTDRFKVRVINKYIERPCWMVLGIDAGESRRARLSSENGVENRYPLIEEGIDRDGCKKIILEHGLDVPRKSGCYFCPYQSVARFRELRHRHPELICKIRELEDVVSRKLGRRYGIKYTANLTIDAILNERQMNLWSEFDYPPCQCGV